MNSTGHGPTRVGWTVRRATIADGERLAMLAADTFPLACPPGFDAEAIARHIRQRLSADAFRINLADVDLEYALATDAKDGTLGYLMLSAAPSQPVVPGPPLLELRQIYVRTQYHGSGRADDLMRLAVRRAAERGLAGVFLGTSKVNARAIAFYQRHGFQITGERVFLVGEAPNDDWIMVLRL